MHPFVIPGYLDYLNFPELKMRIVAPIDHTPRGPLMAYTEKYQLQVRLKPDIPCGTTAAVSPSATPSLRLVIPRQESKRAGIGIRSGCCMGLRNPMSFGSGCVSTARSHAQPTMIPPGNFMLLSPRRDGHLCGRAGFSLKNLNRDAPGTHSRRRTFSLRDL
jgi:hypothetical protein